MPTNTSLVIGEKGSPTEYLPCLLEQSGASLRSMTSPETLGFERPKFPISNSTVSIGLPDDIRPTY